MSKGRWLRPLGVALLGCSVTVAAFLTVKAQAVRAERREFSWVIQELAHDLETQIQLIFTHQIGMAETLSRLPPRHQEGFERVVSALAPSCGPSCIRGIGYFPRVPVERKEQWQEAVRAAARPRSSQAAMTVEPARTKGPDFFPALMVSPLASNRDIFGKDLMAIEGHHENLVRLLRRGDRVALTEPLRFDLEAHGGRPTVLVIAPVYGDWARLDTLDRRRQSLRALVIAGLGVDRILADALPATKRSNVGVRIFDLGPVGESPRAPTRAGLLLDTEKPLAEGSEHPIPGPDFAQDPFHGVKILELGGRHWGLYASRSLEPFYRSNALAPIVLLFGWILTILAVLMVLRSQRTSDRLEAEVARRTADLRDSHRKLGVVVADLERSHGDLKRYAKLAAHDLCEPSRGIASFAQLLSRHLERANLLDQDSDDYLSHLEQAARHMRATAEGFAAYTQVVAATHCQIPLAGEQVRAKVSARLASVRDGGLGIESLAGHVEWGDIPDLTCDPSRVGDAIFHLLRNALTFVAVDRPIQVRVVGEVIGPWWVLEVQDNGLGIPREDMERLTEPFARGDRTRIPGPGGGPGIGLAIARRVAERHGGRLELEPASNGVGLIARLILRREGTPSEEEGQGENCSLRIRSSRLCSGSNSNVREMRRFSLISTRATSRTSV